MLALTNGTELKDWAIWLAREYAASGPDSIHVPTLARELQARFSTEKEAREAIGNEPCIADL